MAVYDCTNFLNENDLYEIRLNEHWDFVDKFIVVEAGETHTGVKKQLKFDHARFAKYSSKLVYVSFDSFDDEMKKFPEYLDSAATRDRGENTVTKDWTRGYYQGNYVMKVLADINAKDDDIIIFSCLDEIHKKSAMQEAFKIFENKNTSPNSLRPILYVQMYLYAYKINLLHQHWTTHACSTISEYSNFKKILPATMRESYFSLRSFPDVPDGGWHFTFLDNTDGEMVLEKQKSWAHSKDIYPGKKRKFDHQTKQEAVDRFFEDYKVEIVEITKDTHPKYIIDNLDKMQNLIFRK